VGREGVVVDDEIAVAGIEMELGGGIDFGAPIGGLAVGEMLPAAGGGFAAGGEPALDLGRGTELVMAHGDAAWRGDAHVGGPGGAFAPDKAWAMPEEAGLGVISDVMAREILRDAALAGALVAGHIQLREEILDVDGPDDVVPAGDGGEKVAGIDGVEFIDIGAAPPVSRERVLAVVVEDLGAEAVVEWFGVGAEEENPAGICGGAFAGNLPGAVGAAVIVDINDVAPGEFLAERVLHDVGLVLGQADSVNFHRRQSRSSEAGNAMRLSWIRAGGFF